jgi:hypothetical protein
VLVTAQFGKGAEQLVPAIKSNYNFATILMRSEIDAEFDEIEGLVRPLMPKLSEKDYDRFNDIKLDLYEKLRTIRKTA